MSAALYFTACIIKSNHPKSNVDPNDGTEPSRSLLLALEAGVFEEQPSCLLFLNFLTLVLMWEALFLMHSYG